MYKLLTKKQMGDPVVVYLPGIDGSPLLASNFLARAESLFPVTRLHYPSHHKITLEEMADGCVSALTEQGYENAIWLGDSFGSSIALTIARRHPRSTVGLVLSGGMSHCHSPLKMLFLARIWERLPLRLKKLAVRSLYHPLIKHYPNRFSYHLLDELNAAAQWDSLSWRLRLLAAFDLRSYISHIRVPTLYLGGEDDSWVRTMEETRLIRENIPDSRTFLFPGCGHFVLAERPAEALELIEMFLPFAARAAA
jgi:pimeloyl-ACP methyl ester carboxylesterase